MILQEGNKVPSAFQTYLTMGSFYSENLLRKICHRIHFGNADYSITGRKHQNTWNSVRYLKTKRNHLLNISWVTGSFPHIIQNKLLILAAITEKPKS